MSEPRVSSKWAQSVVDAGGIDKLPGINLVTSMDVCADLIDARAELARVKAERDALAAQVSALRVALAMAERMRHGDSVLCAGCGAGTATTAGSPPLSERHAPNCWLARPLYDTAAAAAEYDAAMIREGMERAAVIAGNVHAPASIGRDHGRHHEAGAQVAAKAIREAASEVK